MIRLKEIPYERLACVVLVAVAITATSLSTAQTTRKASLSSPEVIAVKFHADWCGSCRTMGPVMTDLQNKFDGKPALFVTFNLTNQSSSHQSELHAAALGLQDLWAQNAGKTGKIYLIDADSKETVATLTKNDDFKAMGAALSGAL